MRPIAKGNWPLTPKTKKRKALNDWTNAIPDLEARTGPYCNFCERIVTDRIAIEHIFPKEDYPPLSGRWSNFLLGCSNCNSSKGRSIPASPYHKSYFWPHLHNTFMVFDYAPATGVITPKTSLSPSDQQRAEKTIRLYALDRVTKPSGVQDYRHKKRLEALKDAVDQKLAYMRGENTNIDLIVKNALRVGFFSLWLETFKTEPQIYQALIDCPEFKLAGHGFFDASYQAVKRNGNEF